MIMSENKINDNNDQNITNHQDLDVSIIPVTEIKSYKDNELNECTQYDSGELADYSNLSLTTTNDSSGSNLCVHHNKVNPLDDPIIQEMFKQRNIEMDKVEEERRIRMYTMMRYSKKYKHLQTERANIKWDQDNNYENTEGFLKGSDGQLGIPDSEGNSLEDHDKLTNWFSDEPPKIQRSISVKHSQSNFGIDLHDLDLIDMELNNCHSNNSENSNDENKEEQSTDNNHSDDEHEEIYSKDDVKVYSNTGEQNYDEITKSNSKLSTSSSENDNNNDNELIKSHYKLSSRSISSSRSLSKMKSQSLCITSDEQIKINNYLSSSDITTDNNTIANSISNSNSITYGSNDFSNYGNSIHLYPHKDSQLVLNTKEKKKHKKLKLFKLGHKNKNTIEINDTNTLSKVVFNSKNSIDNSSDDTVNPSLSILDYAHEQYNKENEKKKKYAFVKFFLGKKYSKPNENEIKNEVKENVPYLKKYNSILRVPNSEKCHKRHAYVWE